MSPLEHLIKLLNLDGAPVPIVDISRSSDGHYMGQVPGDIGFNFFIGKPGIVHDGPGLSRTLATWEELEDADRAAVVRTAAVRGIPLEYDFGIPVDAFLAQPGARNGLPVDRKAAQA